MIKQKISERIEWLREGIVRLGYYASEANYLGMYAEEEGAMDMQESYFKEIDELKSKLEKIETLEKEIDLAELGGDYEKSHYLRMDLENLMKGESL
ncbi:hypothetical protein [uncultured Fusobacterium sp.]|uniref:hypothetical protein n=1 Tax=uncultured Fusobacterium sp. TaxID=159267 RepID=UPI0025FCE6ED|nr:hypothetical protein [uncultured Fusobacterium sp.]